MMFEDQLDLLRQCYVAASKSMNAGAKDTLPIKQALQAFECSLPVFAQYIGALSMQTQDATRCADFVAATKAAVLVAPCAAEQVPAQPSTDFQLRWLQHEQQVWILLTVAQQLRQQPDTDMVLQTVPVRRKIQILNAAKQAALQSLADNPTDAHTFKMVFAALNVLLPNVMEALSNRYFASKAFSEQNLADLVQALHVCIAAKANIEQQILQDLPADDAFRVHWMSFDAALDDVLRQSTKFLLS